MTSTHQNRGAGPRHGRTCLAERLAVALVLALLPGTAAAQSWTDGTGLYVEGGVTSGPGKATRSLTVGALVPSTLFPSIERRAGPLTLHWDLWLSDWRAPAPAGGARDYTQIGALAAWRHPLGGRDAPWFIELAAGGSVLDRLYVVPDRRFSTAFQFTEALALGYRFGRRRTMQVSLRLQHFSNGDIRKPNPGQNFARLRFAVQF